MEKVPMTAAGFLRLEQELHELKEQRPKIVEQIAEARAHGDLSENAEYHAAREKQGMVEARVKYLADILSRAEQFSPATMSGTSITFGVTVTLVDENTDEEVRYQIVGGDESDIKLGRLSVTAPLARALIGKSVGDRAEVETPKGKRAYEILKIEWI